LENLFLKKLKIIKSIFVPGCGSCNI